MSKALKAQDSALILIDHQIISMSMIKTQALEIAKHNNIALVKAAKILGIPSVWTSSNEDANKDWWMPGLEEINRDAYARRIKRTGIINSWNDPDFVRAVEATGRHSLIMAGTTNDGSCSIPPSALGGLATKFTRSSMLAARLFRFPKMPLVCA